MDSFSLFLSSVYDPFLLDIWFSNIFNRRVKNLRIHSQFQLSFSVLASDSLFKNFILLEELELLVNSISHIKVPISIEELELLTNSVYLANAPSPTKSIRFQNLKLLKLCGIFFNTHSPKSPNYIKLKLSSHF
ncbi:hypothetical protein MtrunA17_Chr1g0156851 [Medicago truncatula]|uniref:Uncharacterized protein n=1 Tax=Medicago truncatula TaxID=3880 RepID=G7I7R7_MEDTR|nr:hypothetical protein MTR_1g025600 [Medicago truncatula]RHN77631.1 hypothetical protein MtrunA17_Chr1g0156851 [Medicago truncatula]